MITNFNLHLTVFHLKCKVMFTKQNNKNVIITFCQFSYIRQEGSQTSEAVCPNGKTDKMYIKLKQAIRGLTHDAP